MLRKKFWLHFHVFWCIVKKFFLHRVRGAAHLVQLLIAYIFVHTFFCFVQLLICLALIPVHTGWVPGIEPDGLFIAAAIFNKLDAFPDSLPAL